MASTLFQKVWDAHSVRRLPTGQTQLFIGLHLIHEVTSPQAFDMLRARGDRVAFPDRTIATVDHIVPTKDQRRPFLECADGGVTPAFVCEIEPSRGVSLPQQVLQALRFANAGKPSASALLGRFDRNCLQPVQLFCKCIANAEISFVMGANARAVSLVLHTRGRNRSGQRVE